VELSHFTGHSKSTTRQSYFKNHLHLKSSGSLLLPVAVNIPVKPLNDVSHRIIVSANTSGFQFDAHLTGCGLVVPMTTTTMAAVTDGSGVWSSDGVSLMGRIATLLGSEENALRILLSLLLGLSSAVC